MKGSNLIAVGKLHWDGALVMYLASHGQMLAILLLEAIRTNTSSLIANGMCIMSFHVRMCMKAVRMIIHSLHFSVDWLLALFRKLSP